MERIVFASDFHLGINGAVTSEEREKLLVRWIEEVAMSASEVFLLGDIFDFWFEYKKAIPGFRSFSGRTCCADRQWRASASLYRQSRHVDL